MEHATVDDTLLLAIRRLELGFPVTEGWVEQRCPDGVAEVMRLLDAYTAITNDQGTVQNAFPFTVDRVLGSGGMGTVYLAHMDEQTAYAPPGRAVAVKVLRADLMDSEGESRGAGSAPRCLSAPVSRMGWCGSMSKRARGEPS